MSGRATVVSVLEEARRALASAGVDSPRLDSEVLLAHCLGVDRNRLVTAGAELDPSPLARFRELIARRTRREPVAYITGTREFWSLAFEVTPAVLIPRPETEHAVARLLRMVPGSGLVADIGTGSGAIAVAAAHERPGLTLVGVDVSAEALAVARRNATRHGVEGRVHLVQGDLLEPFRRGPLLSAIVSNPPYIGREEEESLMPDVRDYEPEVALFDQASPPLLKRLAEKAPGVLQPGGALIVEIAPQRATEMTGYLEEATCWEGIVVEKDYAGRARLVHARLSERYDQR